MISARDQHDLECLQSLLDDAYRQHFHNHNDGGHKSSEGQISVEFNNFFEREQRRADFHNPRLQITSVTIYSYVFGPRREHTFGSVAEALAVVRRWRAAEIKSGSDAQDAKE